MAAKRTKDSTTKEAEDLVTYISEHKDELSPSNRAIVQNTALIAKLFEKTNEVHTGVGEILKKIPKKRQSKPKDPNKKKGPSLGDKIAGIVSDKLEPEVKKIEAATKANINAYDAKVGTKLKPVVDGQLQVSRNVTTLGEDLGTKIDALKTAVQNPEKLLEAIKKDPDYLKTIKTAVEQAVKEAITKVEASKISEGDTLVIGKGDIPQPKPAPSAPVLPPTPVPTAVVNEIQQTNNRLDSLEASSRSANRQLGDLASILAGIKPTIEAANGNSAAARAAAESVNSQFSNVNTNLGAVKGAVETMAGQITAQNQANTETYKRLDDMQRELSSVNGNIAATQEAVSALDKKFGSAVSEFQESADEQRKGQKELYEKIDNVKAQAEKGVGLAIENNGYVKEIMKKIDEIQTDVPGLADVPDKVNELCKQVPELGAIVAKALKTLSRQNSQIDQKVLEEAIAKIIDDKLNVLGGGIMKKLDSLEQKMGNVKKSMKVVGYQRETIGNYLQGSVSIKRNGSEIEAKLGRELTGIDFDSKHVYEVWRDVSLGDEGFTMDEPVVFVYANLAEPAKKVLRLQPVQEYMQGLESKLNTYIESSEELAPEWKMLREDEHEKVYEIPGSEALLSLFELSSKSNNTEYRVRLTVKPDADKEYGILTEEQYVNVATLTVKNR
ncbi:hypothetical protein KY312_04840 [Candidatus Woesearchaeota archaeon]|nr:hypothetical protein [Candidatus Woesearchaeota archaeon]